MERRNYSAFYAEGYPTEDVVGIGKQLVVLDLLQRYDLLDSKTIRGHISSGQSDAYGEKLLTKLCKGHYIGLPDVLRTQKPKPRRQTYVYQLYDRGKALLQERGLWLNRRRLSDPHPHKVLRCLTQYSLEHPPAGIRLISEREIVADDRCSASVRVSPNPSYFKIGAKETQPDGPLTGYEYNDTYMFFHGFEADNGTEDIEDTASNRRYGRVTLEQKIRSYTAYLEHEMHLTLYGLGRVYIPFVFRAGLESRMLSAIHLLKRKYPQQQSRFIFTTYTPDLANATWRTTAGTFNIVEKLKGGE